MASLFRASCNSPLQFRSKEDVRWCAATQTNTVFIVIATVAIYLSIGLTIDKFEKINKRGRAPVVVVGTGQLAIGAFDHNEVIRAIRESDKNEGGGTGTICTGDSHWSWRVDPIWALAVDTRPR